MDPASGCMLHPSNRDHHSCWTLRTVKRGTWTAQHFLDGVPMFGTVQTETKESNTTCVWMCVADRYLHRRPPPSLAQSNRVSASGLLMFLFGSSTGLRVSTPLRWLTFQGGHPIPVVWPDYYSFGFVGPPHLPLRSPPMDQEFWGLCTASPCRIWSSSLRVLSFGYHRKILFPLAGIRVILLTTEGFSYSIPFLPLFFFFFMWRTRKLFSPIKSAYLI